MHSLMLHCGADAIDRSALATLPLPDVRGPRHAVRPFIEDVELVTQFMRTEGIHIEDEAYGVTRDEEGFPRRFFGVLQTRLDNLDGRDGYGLMIGLRGSYDQTLSRALAVGSRIFVCDNLAFSGEITISTKQTTNVARRIPQMLQDAVAQIPALAHRQSARFDAYRNTALSQADGDHILADLVREKALIPSHFGMALQQWDEPAHDEHAEQGFSLWRLHNAVTEAIKPTNPDRAAVPVTWERTRTMTRVFDQIAGLNEFAAEEPVAEAA